MTLPNKRKKLLILSDHPLIPSGVGSQAKYLCEGLLETGDYKLICLGGAIQHPDYRPQQVAPEKFEDNWLIIPVNGHGDKSIVRSILQTEKPDAMIIFTDPRFFYWVWEFEDEIRQVCPLLYWHVWDNDPTPTFNKIFYESTDFVSALSLKTYGLLQDLGYPKERFNYIPHSVPSELFKPLPEDQIQEFKNQHYGPHRDKKFVVFWNNRNARRKMTGDVIQSFAMAAEELGKKDCLLMMHTAPRDQEGQDILACAKNLGVDDCLMISDDRLEPGVINWFYNVADVTINIANNEGFGLGTLESLFAGTPIVTTFTGGLQYQIGDWWEGREDFTDQSEITAFAKKRWASGKGKWWGAPIFPTSRAYVGSQQVPFIYDDRYDNKQVARELVKLAKMGRTKRKALGLEAREWVKKNFAMSDMISKWDSTIVKVIDNHNMFNKRNYREAEI